MNWRQVFRILAESYILHRIGSLDGESEQRLLDMMSEMKGPKRTAAEWCDNFAGEQSVTVDVAQWIEKEWPKRRAADPSLTPQQFAAEVASDLFIEFDF